MKPHSPLLATAPLAATQKAKGLARKQRGFSLIEIMAGIAIMAIMSLILMSSFSGDGSKAVRLLGDMNTLGNSLNRAKMDLGGIPSRLSVLWSRTDATAANMFNGIAATNTWGGPYVERQPVDAANNVTVSAVADATTISINREAASAANGGNYTWVYFLRANNVPNPIITEFIKKCAATDVVANATFANGKCRATPGTGATEFGTVDMKITDSR
jgi:prepilin-type N-terminal cleavage/methylation domain-containing protein